MYSRIIVFSLLAAMWVLIATPYLNWNWWIGIVSCLFVMWLAFRMQLIDRYNLPLRFYFKVPIYVIWLLGRIIVANINVARQILSPKLPIAPHYIDVDVKRPYEITRVFYANSITLTPGTVSASLEDDMLRVHVLSHKSAHDIESGALEKKIAWLER